MTKQELYNIIEKNMRAVKEDYDYSTGKSFDLAISNLKGGDMMPERGRFHDDGNRNEYNSKLEAHKREAMDAVNAYLAGLTKTTAAVPSAEALRAVQMFSLLDPGTLTKEDYAKRIDAMMTEYGQDSTTYETLRGLAKKAGIDDFRPHKDIMARDAASYLAKNVAGFFDGNRSNNTLHDSQPSDGQITFTLMTIESDLGDLE